jgi:hypothetical protein
MLLRSLLACALVVTPGASATDISASGTWSPSLKRSDLAAGAGGVLRSMQQSPAGQVMLSISNAGAASWEIVVRNDGAVLPAGVQMSIRVAAAGTGGAQVLLAGSGDRTGVLLQFRLDGISVRNDVGHYATTVIYSLR